MRVIFTIWFVLLLFVSNGFSQSIFENPITGTNPNTSNPYTTGQTVNTNITVSGIGRGSGIAGNAGNDRYNANGWNSSSLDVNDYFYFTINPNSGIKVDFINLVVTLQRSNASLTNFVLRSSLDSYGSDIEIINYGTGTGAVTKTISLAGMSFQNITSPITFRLFAWGASAATTTFSINDFTFNGTACNLADYCNLQFPSTQTICQGSNFTSYGQIYEPGFTEAADSNTAIVAQWGYNTSNTDPSTWPSGNWSNARWNVQSFNNDEYRKTTGASLGAGTYYYTFRYSIDNCNYQYGGYSAGGGGIWNGTTNVNGVLTVDPTTIPGAVNGGTSVCPGTNSTLLTLSGHNGSIIKWQSSTDNFMMNIVDIVNTTTTYTATNLSNTTSYRAVVKSGSCLETPSSSTTVSVYSSPVPNAASNSPVCVGNTLNLTSNSGFNNYSWSGPNMFSSSDEDPSIANVTSAANGNYTLMVTDGNSCTASQTFAVAINNLPNVQISGLDSICSGQTTTLTASGASNYTWSNMASGNTINVGIGTYSVTGTDGNGCSNSDSHSIFLKSTNNNNNSGIFESYAVLGSNQYYDLQNPTGNPDFQGANLGSFIEGGTFLFKGGEIKTYKNSGADICGGKIYYSVFPSVGMPGSFSSVNFNFISEYPNPPFDNVMTSNPGDQQWANTSSMNNILTGLNPGTYKIAVYVDVYGNHPSQTSCGCDPMHVQNNNGAYWIADFTVTTACDPIEAGTITGDNTLCVGESTTLTTDGDGDGEWTSSDEDVAIVDNAGEVTALMEGSTIIKYIVFGAMACPDDSATFNLTVNANPVVEVIIDETSGIAEDDGVICVGAPVTLTASGGTSYMWDGGITNGVAFMPVIMTTYNVTVTDINNCSAVESETININTLPTATISTLESSGVINDDGTICTGASVTLSGGGASTYVWNNMVTNGVSFVPVSTTTYTVTATDINGCTDTETKTITINTNPTASISITDNTGLLNNDGTICSGFTITLSGVGASVYTWNNNINNGVAFAPLNTTTYILTATDNNGCTDTESTTVTVNNSPTANITIADNSGVLNNDGTICSGFTVTLTGGGGTTYVWNNGVTDGVAFLPVSTTTYTVTATDGNGCTNSISTTITVNNNPNASVSIAETSGTTNNDGNICEGALVSLSGGGATSYVWDLGVLNGVSFIPNGTTTFTVTATDANGCTDTETALISVNTLPDAYIDLNNSPSCEGTFAKFTLKGTAEAEVEYNIDGGSPVLDTLDNTGELNVQVPMGSLNISLFLTNVRNTNTNCSKPLSLSSTVVVLDTSVTNFYTTSCNTYTWPENGFTYTASELDTVTLYKTNGCDSLIILNLTINNSEYDTTYVTSCSNYTWSLDGNTYSLSGTYIYESTNMITNCQDTSVLILTIGTSNVYNPNDPGCYTNITDALQNASIGDTVFINGGTYLESFEIPAGVTLQINAGGTVNNVSVICNMGVLILNGGQFINTGAYQGRGIFVGNFVNTSTGSISPKVCGN